MGLVILVLVVCALLVLLIPGKSPSQSEPVTGRRTRLVWPLVGLGILLLVAAGFLYLLAYGAAHEDTGTTWSNNAQARDARTFSVLLGLAGLASLVASLRVRRRR